MHDVDNAALHLSLASDWALWQVLWSIRWSGSRAWKTAHQGGTGGGTLNAEHRVRLSMDLGKDNTDPVGKQYRLQLLFNEKCCSRGFDIIVGERTGSSLGAVGARQGTIIAKGFSPERTQGGIHPGGPENHAPASAAIVVYDFTAVGRMLTVELNGEDASSCSEEGTNSGSQVSKT